MALCYFYANLKQLQMVNNGVSEFDPSVIYCLKNTI